MATKLQPQLTIEIDIDDVRVTGSVAAAIARWCAEDGEIACGVVGPAFATSGPGPGWTKVHDCNDFARQAFAGGALYYVDPDDGRLAWETSEDNFIWTDESVVRLECPLTDDILASPGIAAEMAQAVVTRHGALSDRRAWADLIVLVRDAAAALADVDVSKLER